MPTQLAQKRKKETTEDQISWLQLLDPLHSDLSSESRIISAPADFSCEMIMLSLGGLECMQKCHLNSIANPGSGSLTAQKRSSKGEDTGFSFVGCVVTGSGPIYLGRAWGPYSRVVFIRTYIEDLIIPAGWYDWGLSSRRKYVLQPRHQLCSLTNKSSHINFSLRSSQICNFAWILYEV